MSTSIANWTDPVAYNLARYHYDHNSERCTTNGYGEPISCQQYVQMLFALEGMTTP